MGEIKISQFAIPQRGKRIESILKEIEPPCSSRSKGGTYIGYPQTQPHEVAIRAYEKYLAYNSNHVGVFTEDGVPNSKTRIFEQRTIQMLGNLYGCDDVDGYVSSGGTESNIMALWIAKRKACGRLIGAIQSPLTHISVEKACQLCGVQATTTSLNKEYQMDISSLKTRICELAQKGCRDILLYLTMGYTLTGTCDSINVIDVVLTELHKKLDLQFYVHIDAAIGGLTFPFLEPDRNKWMQYRWVNSLSVDFHKMGYVPYSAGIFLCKKGYLNAVSIKDRYSHTYTSKTLIGSRNGAAAVSCYAMLKYLGVEGYKKILEDLIEAKEYLLSRLLQDNAIEIITNPPVNMCCVHFTKLQNHRLSVALENKYATRPFELFRNGNVWTCYKLYIMPHVTKQTLDALIADVEYETLAKK